MMLSAATLHFITRKLTAKIVLPQLVVEIVHTLADVNDHLELGDNVVGESQHVLAVFVVEILGLQAGAVREKAEFTGPVVVDEDGKLLVEVVENLVVFLDALDELESVGLEELGVCLLGVG